MTTVVVAGGSGVLGAMIGAEVRRLLPEAQLVVGDHRAERGARTAQRLGADSVLLDADDPASIRRALSGADLVIAALRQRAPLLQTASLELGIHCVDVTASGDLTARIRGLDGQARAAGVALVAMAGLFPGLSGLLAKEAAAKLDRVDRLDVALLQNTNGDVGPSGTVDMLRAITAPVHHNGRTEPGFRRRFSDAPTMRLIDYAERQVLATELGLTATAYWAGWNSVLFTAAVALLVRTRVLPRFAPGLATFKRHDPTQPETVLLQVRARGTQGTRETEAGFRLTAESDYGATASVAVAMSALALEERITGAGTPLSVTTLNELTARMRSPRVEIRDL